MNDETLAAWMNMLNNFELTYQNGNFAGAVCKKCQLIFDTTTTYEQLEQHMTNLCKLIP